MNDFLDPYFLIIKEYHPTAGVEPRELEVTIEELPNYAWSSFRDYIRANRSNLADLSFILSEFGKDAKRYEKFDLNHAEHQKMLEYVKYTQKWSK